MPAVVLLAAPRNGTMPSPLSDAHTTSAVTSVAAPRPVTASRDASVFLIIQAAAITTAARDISP
jgi:hypothetical protein